MMPAALFRANYAPSFPDEAVAYPADVPIYCSNASNINNVVSVDFKRKRFREEPAEAPLAPWKSIASGRIARLRGYAAGWDGPASREIAPTALAKAGRMLDLAFGGMAHPAPPSAVPCADGSLQLEWWLVDTRFELSIDADGELYAWAENRNTGDEVEAEGTGAINLLIQWSRRLTSDKLSTVK